MNWATLQGLRIPEGVVTKISNGISTLWELIAESKPVVLEVAKQTLTTYAGGTSYANEDFILLDIYPKKSNSVINVTYGGLTKTLTFSGTNAQKVYFGTFNGVSDSVATPASGQLVIEGECDSFSRGSFTKSVDSKGTASTGYYTGINSILSTGSASRIIASAFAGCVNLTNVVIADGITSIASNAFPSGNKIYFTVDGNNQTYSSENGALFDKTKTTLMMHQTASGNYVVPSTVTKIEAYAFSSCDSLTGVTFPNGLVSIGNYAFSGCSNLALTSLPNGLVSIGDYAFQSCLNLVLTSFPNGLVSIGNYAFYMMPPSFDSDGYAKDTDKIKMMNTNIVLPATLGSLGDNAFAYLFKTSSTTKNYWSTLTMLGTTPPTMSTLAKNVSNGSIIVPVGCGEIYKTAEGWSTYADRIVEAS